ncbi:MAG: NAD(P)H-hydrate epimerase [Leptolyngbya sp. PLA3]|nr:MAG: NAD(P)H-hydrate epimerase [Cyanobacteria bacterium CYA]MCE7967409.1 NAD(P)H-hydrate epimerase [Leptolyngbya sp. PL-A3]
MSDLTLTTAQIRAIDRLAVERYHIPSILLMEHASLSLFAEARRLMGQDGLQAALILVGPGNNGGDGLALARHLHNAGVRVRVVLGCDPVRLRGDAKANFDIARAMGIEMAQAGGVCEVEPAETSLPRPLLVVDALLGTGVDRAVGGVVGELVAWINAARRGPVLSVDVPSGLDSDLGPVHGDCVRADVTVTFVARKVGFEAPGAEPYLGQVVVGSIGAPPELVRLVERGLVDGRG